MTLLKRICVVWLVLLGLAISVSANTLWSGSLVTTNPGEVFATGAWDGGGDEFMVTWNHAIVGNHVHYSYTFSNSTGGLLSRSIEYVIIQVSNNFGAGDVFNSSDGTPVLRSDNTVKTRWTATDPILDVGLPAPISGLNFDANNSKLFTVSFDSTRLPMWGNVYARDGLAPPNSVDVYANTGSANKFGDNIGVPDTRTVPVPAAVWSGGVLLLGLGGAYKLRSKRMA